MKKKKSKDEYEIAAFIPFGVLIYKRRVFDDFKKLLRDTKKILTEK